MRQIATIMSMLTLFACNSSSPVPDKQSVHPNDSAFVGLWIPADVKWEEADPRVGGAPSAGVRTVNFLAGGKFKMFDWLVYKDTVKDSLHVGAEEGRGIYVGEWHAIDSNTIGLIYNLVYSGIEVIGEKIPGDTVRDSMKLVRDGGNTILRFGNRAFTRTNAFDAASRYVISISPSSGELEQMEARK